jgi:2OG-Fe(II) oxygenase superfamily
MTFNLGPQTATIPHTDSLNLAFGWCSIIALGNFNPDEGGELVLWNLKLVVRFPPGSTIFIPSAIIKHSNCPVVGPKRRYSITQWSAAHIFRWVENGFANDSFINQIATKEEKEQRKQHQKKRWEEGLSKYSKLQELLQ